MNGGGPCGLHLLTLPHFRTVRNQNQQVFLGLGSALITDEEAAVFGSYFQKLPEKHLK